MYARSDGSQGSTPYSDSRRHRGTKARCTLPSSGCGGPAARADRCARLPAVHVAAVLRVGDAGGADPGSGGSVRVVRPDEGGHRRRRLRAEGRLVVNPEFLRFSAHLGFQIRTCYSYRTQTRSMVSLRSPFELSRISGSPAGLEGRQRGACRELVHGTEPLARLDLLAENPALPAQLAHARAA